MATESPVRFVGETVIRNWPTTKEALVSSSGDMTSQELGLLFPTNAFNQRDRVPNRSGSAPPSIEGSCAVLNNDTGQRHPSPVGSMVRSTMNELHSYEEQLRSDPSYVAFYISNVNLNPRLPPPITSRETRHLAQHASHSGESWRPNSYNDGHTGSGLLSMSSLPTHKEEISQDSSGNAERIISGQFVSSLEGRHKSLVDLIQEDFPRTPSPVYSNPTVSSSHGLLEDRANSDACAGPLQDASVTAGKTVKLGGRACTKNPDIHSDKSIQSNGSPDIKVPSQHASTKEGSDKNCNDANTSLIDANQGTVVTALQGLRITSENEAQNSRPNPLSGNSLPRGSASQLHILQSHGVDPTYNITNHLPQSQSKLPLTDKKPVLQTTGIGTPLYPATGYLAPGSPVYSNLQQSSVFAPQYNLGGFTVNTPPFPPFIAGYPPPGAIPIGFESPTTVGINGTNANIAASVDLQHLYKYHGQLGVVLQPPFAESLCMPYFPHPSLGAHGAPVQYDQTNRGYDPQKELPAYSPDQREMHIRGGNLNIPSPIKVGLPSPTHFGSPPNVGVLLQYPPSPLASPQLPGSPLAQPALPVRRPENVKLPVCSIQNAGAYSSWQVMRGREKLGDPKTYSILEELKSNRARRFELSDVVGHIVDFSTDQHGSRFIQQKLETCSPEEKASVFSEVLPRSAMLMTDVFGNYVIQKFFEYGNIEQTKELAIQLVGRVLPLSLQMYGCRVIQKALEVVELDQKTQLVLELDGHVMRCVRDQNGNHVIQKCIECVPTNRILFIISAFFGQVATLSMHPYGCRVIQRVLEHCTDDFQTQHIVDEILQSACLLAQDQYGNYVIQHVLERGRPHERNQIISKLAGQVVQMSQHKFASNVIEKCLEHGDTAERECMIEEIVGETEGNDVLLMMMKDQFANYVVQKILETCNDKQREILLNRIRVHLQALKRYTYGKHIVTRVEQLSGEESHVASE